MTVALRSLRVNAELDASKFTAGAKGVETSSNTAGAAVSKLGETIGDKLERRFVPGAAAAYQFQKAVDGLGRGLDKGAVTIQQAERVLDGLHAKYGMTANAADLMARGQATLAATVTTVNARISESASSVAALNARITGGVDHTTHLVTANDNIAASSKNAAFQQRNLQMQLGDTFQSIALGMPISQVLLQQGPQIAQIYGAGEGGIGRAFKETAGMAVSLVARLWPVVAAGATVYGAYKLISANSAEAALSVSDLTHQLAEQAVSAGQVAGMISDLAGVQKTYDSALEATRKTHGVMSESNIANTEREFNAKKSLLELQLKYQQALIETQRAEMAQKSLALKSDIAGTVNIDMGRAVRGGYSDPRVGNLVRLPDDITGLSKTQDMINANPITDELKKIQAELTLNEIAAGKLSDALQTTFNASGTPKDPKTASGKKVRESDYERAIRRTQEQTKATAEEARVIELSTYAQERQSTVQDILTAAQRDGLAIGKQFANAQELINASSTSLSPALAKERERILGVAGAYAQAKADAEEAETARRKYEEAMSFFGGVTRDAIDTFEGALKNGSTMWQAFGEAALSVLDKIKNKLLDEVVDALFAVNDAGSGSGGGILSTLFSGAASFFGGGSSDPWAGKRVASAKGNVFTSPSLSAFSNQIVDRPTYFAFAKGAGVMGEAGPEGIFPLRRDASGRLGVTGTAANQNAPIHVSYAPVYNVQGYGQDIENLKKQMRQDRQEFGARVVSTVRKARTSRDL